MKLQYSCCHPLQQLIFARSFSTSKRPPKLGQERTQKVQRQAPRLNVLTAPHFKYHEMAQNHLKKFHAGLIPQRRNSLSLQRIVVHLVLMVSVVLLIKCI